jgi:hypothetical protein
MAKTCACIFYLENHHFPVKKFPLKWGDCMKAKKLPTKIISRP